MEGAATAKISRAQLWQWIRHQARLTDGRTVDLALCRTVLAEELEAIKSQLAAESYARGRFADAADLFVSLVAAAHFPEWLSVPADEKIIAEGR
jgi:malate synthase